MKAARPFRWIVAIAAIAAMLASVIPIRTLAQSEYMRGDRMPYDAFDRLPRTDLDIGGGTIHVAFAPGDAFRSARSGCCWCPSRAGASVAARHGVIAAPRFVFRSAAIPPRTCCAATG